MKRDSAWAQAEAETVKRIIAGIQPRHGGGLIWEVGVELAGDDGILLISWRSGWKDVLVSSRVFGLYTWKNRAAIWEHCNLWAQLGVCVKDRGPLMEVVPSNHRVCENALWHPIRKECGWDYERCPLLLGVHPSKPLYTYSISSWLFPTPDKMCSWERTSHLLLHVIFLSVCYLSENVFAFKPDFKLMMTHRVHLLC